MLLTRLLELMSTWRSAFARASTHVRARSMLVALLCANGRRTVSAGLCFEGRSHCDWSADYRVFNRAPWKPHDLFACVLEAGLRHVPASGPVIMFLDDTSLKKSSRVISAAGWLRDPLSPPFHVNLRKGLRFLHTALCLPLHRDGHSARAVSTGFDLAPPAKKPRGKEKTDPVAIQRFHEQQKKLKLTVRAVEVIHHQRRQLDELGHRDRRLLFVVDGSLTNKTVFCGLPERTDLLGRTRKDIALFEPAPPGGRRVYGDRLPTPEKIRQDESKPYRKAICHYGGDFREVRYKEVAKVLWKGGAKRRPLRLLIIAPTPYRAPGSGRRSYYRQPAYLLTTDLDTPAEELIQAYFDRWQIEVLHREVKTGVAIHQPQVWSGKAVKRLHSALVATYAMLTLAALDVFGPERSDAFPPLPAWRDDEERRRASHNDLVTMLRNDVAAAAPLRGPPPARKQPSLPAGWTLPLRETYATA